MSSDYATSTNQIPARGQLTAAVRRDNLETVADLLKRGADVEDADDKGNTALMTAVVGEPDIVLLLVQRGADPYRKNERRRNAWDLLKEDVDISWHWSSAAIQIEKILSEAPNIRREFIEKIEQQAKAAAAEASSKRREWLKTRTHKVTIKP